MFCEAVRGCVAFVALLAFLINGGTVVSAQVKSSTIYSTYDPRELVKSRKYKGIDFADGESGDEFTMSQLSGKGPKKPKSHSKNTKSSSYHCRIQTTGADAFNVADFLDWLAKATIDQIESGKGAIVGQRHRVGKRFYIEYDQNGFIGRIEVDADVLGKDQMSLEVEIVESSRK